MLKKVNPDMRKETRRQLKDITDCGFRSFVDKLNQGGL